ncbi:hypothetical protein JCM6882_005156 [Rhodosporidiobolus microsporus]
MHAFSALLSLAGFVSFAAAVPVVNLDVPLVRCPTGQFLIQESNTCTTQWNCPQGPSTVNGVRIQGTYKSADGKDSEPGYVKVGSQCVANSVCVAQGGFVRTDPQTVPVRNYYNCINCPTGFSAFVADNKCTACPVALGQAARCTADKALTCKAGFVLYEDKCLSQTCPSGWYSENGVCKDCKGQDPNSVTCELGKSLTCGPFRYVIEDTGVCTTTAACPQTATTIGGIAVRPSYKDVEAGKCRPCPPGAASCKLQDGQVLVNNCKTAGYAFFENQCITNDECMATDNKRIVDWQGNFSCQPCSDGRSAYNTNSICDLCDRAALGSLVRSCTATKALTCKNGGALVSDKCVAAPLQ